MTDGRLSSEDDRPLPSEGLLAVAESRSAPPAAVLSSEVLSVLSRGSLPKMSMTEGLVSWSRDAWLVDGSCSAAGTH
eukprot:435029-Pyramimonas_sp.AAC.1